MAGFPGNAVDEISATWNKWLGPDTEFKMMRDEHVQPITAIQFTPMP